MARSPVRLSGFVYRKEHRADVGGRAGDRGVNHHDGIGEGDRLLLRDAQTSGGLLFAVEPSRFEALLSGLAEAGVPAAAIGEFLPGPQGRVEVVAQAPP